MAVKKIKEEKDPIGETGLDITPTSGDVFSEQENVQEEMKEDMLPLSFVQKMMKELEDKLTNTFIQKINLISSTKSLNEDIDYVQDLEDDWLEIPVVFFAFSFNFSIHGDRKRGEETLPPHGAVRFQPLIRTKKKGHKGIQVVSVSSVKVQSKSVVEYLRGHSQFGIAFYENMESAMNVDSTWAQKMVEAQQSISRLSDMQIIARAKQEGISVSQSPEGMRRQLVEKIAKKAINQQDNILYGAIRTSKLDEKNRSVIERKVE